MTEVISMGTVNIMPWEQATSMVPWDQAASVVPDRVVHDRVELRKVALDIAFRASIAASPEQIILGARKFEAYLAGDVK